jgi:hypothetical protein
MKHSNGGVVRCTDGHVSSTLVNEHLVFFLGDAAVTSPATGRISSSISANTFK